MKTGGAGGKNNSHADLIKGKTVNWEQNENVKQSAGNSLEDKDSRK
jgi:hypothetical protein